MIITTFIFSIISSIFYRISGLKGMDKYLGWFDNYIRDWCIPLLAGIWMYLYYPQVNSYIHLLSFVLMWGAISTYQDSIWGYDSFAAHGIAIGLAYLPYAWTSGLWIGFGIRAVILGALMGLWCKYFSNPWVEELGRGFFIIITLFILLVFA